MFWRRVQLTLVDCPRDQKVQRFSPTYIIIRYRNSLAGCVCGAFCIMAFHGPWVICVYWQMNLAGRDIKRVTIDIESALSRQFELSPCTNFQCQILNRKSWCLNYFSIFDILRAVLISWRQTTNPLKTPHYKKYEIFPHKSLYYCL